MTEPAALFPALPTQVSRERMIKAVDRELRFRLRVYPRRVAERKMSQEQMHEEIAAMQAVLTTLRGMPA